MPTHASPVKNEESIDENDPSGPAHLGEERFRLSLILVLFEGMSVS